MIQLSKINIEQLKWRSRRSQLELDLFFDSYIQKGHLENLSEGGLTKYNDLLELEDGELLLLFQSKVKLNDGIMQTIVEDIIACRR
ncbi:MAG: succinate dehydrogenase assembly factor 2 [Burkholderiales bacterium]|nr:succinate dehydrogenase assembly factor 2 [Burkholderiales bacterium]